MIQFFKFCLISTLSLQGASYVIPSQASSICELSKRSIRYGDLASWNQANSCQTIDLDPQLCCLGISYAENEEVKKSLQRATAGNAVVYLLPEVVIKELGEDESKSRRKKDELALQIIEEKGYDHLAVPSSCVQSSYSINERLPIMNFSDSGLLYYQHPDDFTSAVEQFVHLTLEVPLTDIISTLGNPRFDNVVPYLTEESGKWIGKLGLVDLEHFAPGKETSWEMARDLIQFFPHHYENIVNIIQQSHPEWIEQRQKEFQVARNSAIKHLLLYTFNAGLENSDVVTRYLEKGAIPAEVVNDTLKAAAVNGLTKLIKKLLEQNVSSSTSRDKSLVFAAEYGHEDIVKILLETENLSLEYKGRAVVQSADQHPDI
ncbi:MAG: ankyrin repeat domain-containing protein, partial [Bdellovibrionales bacterium]|nr:ankyrin repeat domain-containing protein [Bdellovibrionales bacterium]